MQVFWIELALIAITAIVLTLVTALPFYLVRRLTMPAGTAIRPRYVLLDHLIIRAFLGVLVTFLLGAHLVKTYPETYYTLVFWLARLI